MTNIALTPRPDVESEFEDRAERAAIRRLALSGALVTAVASLSVAAWMALAPLHGAVIAPGFVKVDTNRKVVQHREGGVVSRIHVRDGMRVTKGGVLLELEDARIDASVEVARTQLDSELVRGARLAAERDGAAAFVLTAELAERSGDARLRDLIAREERLFKVRRASLSAQLDLFDQQIAAIRSELSVRLTRHATDDAAVRLQQEEIDANRALSDQGFVSRTRLLAMERARTDYEARRGENEAEIARARQRIAELQLKALSLRAGYVDQAAGELKETTARIYDLRERLRPVEDAARRQKIIAPASGVVVALAVSTVGAVVSAGETLLEIVPDDPRLVVEALVRPEDIAGVEVGAVAEVRLTAFKQRLTPTVLGSVEFVSADRLASPDGRSSHYVVRASVSEEELSRAGIARLVAGMPADVFVRTAARTPFEYLAAPLIGFLQRAGREP